MAALKALVIGLGILIVLGLALLVYGLTGGRLGGGGEASLGEILVEAPAGCRIAQSTVAEGRLILRLEGAREQGCQRVLLYDLKSGRALGSYTLAP